MSEEFTGMQATGTDNQSDGSVEQSESAELNENSRTDIFHDIEELPELPDIKAFSAVPNSESSDSSSLNADASEENIFAKNLKGKSAEKAEDNSAKNNNQDFSIEDEVSELDPLMKRPRISAILWCVAIAVLFLLSAVGLWFISVETVTGQSYEEMVISGFGSHGVPSWLGFCLRPLSVSLVIIILGVIISVVAFVVACVRRRWWLVGQCTGIIVLAAAAEPLKKILPRPMLVNIEYLSTNSAPSGHTLLIATACALLICAVSRIWRAWAAIFASFITVLVELSLVEAHWHRSSDVLISVLIVGALTLIILACTRSSGMDMPAYRRSSISVQIVGSSMITLGVLSCLYAIYLVWQILPGVDIFAQWAANVSYLATYWLIIGVSLLVYGVIMVMRHATAAPLNRLGLVGAPPTPPSAA